MGKKKSLFILDDMRDYGILPFPKGKIHSTSASQNKNCLFFTPLGTQKHILPVKVRVSKYAFPRVASQREEGVKIDKARHMCLGRR